MRHKIVCAMMIAAACAITACGGNAPAPAAEPAAEPAQEETVKEDVETAAEEPESTETAQEEEPAAAKPEEPVQESEPEEEPEPLSWLEEQGITISPQGDYSFITMSSDGKKDLIEVEVPFSVTISESTEDAPDGFKQVIAVEKYNIANTPDNNYCRGWCSAFDRYTGTSFEYDASLADEDGFITIENGDQSYKVKFEYKDGGSFPELISTITVTCPEDYDGTVFQYGYSSEELMNKEAEEIDYAERLHTVDELPFFDTNGHQYYYFSSSNS